MISLDCGFFGTSPKQRRIYADVKCTLSLRFSDGGGGYSTRLLLESRKNRKFTAQIQRLSIETASLGMHSGFVLGVMLI